MKAKFKELEKPLFGKYAGMVILPYVFIYLKNKTEHQIKVLKNHENIHVTQVNDEISKLGLILGWLAFYSKYIGYWLKGVLGGYFSTKGKSSRQAYMNIPYEKEAYANERKLTYLSKRKPFAYKNYK